MKYPLDSIDTILDQADYMMKEGKIDRAQRYYIRAIAMMMRNATREDVFEVQIYP